MEGDPEPFISFSSYGSAPHVFVTADWNTRGDEWNNYVNAAKAVSGWMIKDYTGTHGDTNGAFTLNVQYDVSDTNSRIDFNDDGSNEAYTGTMSTSVQYDANGVLSSYSMQSNMQFDQRNSATSSMSITRGGTSFLPSDTVVLVVVGVVAFIIALALGFFIGRSRRPMDMMNSRSSTTQSPPPP
jgi:opacity protein-like surface antigen